jgi:hypothetical protein
MQRNRNKNKKQRKKKCNKNKGNSIKKIVFYFFFSGENNYTKDPEDSLLLDPSI